MARPPCPPAEVAQTLSVLNDDVMAYLAGYLSPRDVASLAMTCRPLRAAVSSDAIWARLFRDQWPSQLLLNGALAAREQYVQRHAAVQQMKFDDPWMFTYELDRFRPPPSHVMIDCQSIWFAQGPVAMRLGLPPNHLDNRVTMLAHSSRITCLRSEVQRHENVLLTASADRTIRLLWKGYSNRCFKGHSGPVTTLADKLLGDGMSKVLASGAEDCTVRLWSINSNGKKTPLITTFHGHQRPLSLLSVAWYKESLLVSISRDSKIRVWDTAVTPSKGIGHSCVGNASVPGCPAAMKCYETLCYVTSGSQMTAIDIRTMKQAFAATVQCPKIHSFEILPSNWLSCVGLEDKALLWDVRKLQEHPVPVAELESNNPVTLLHMDQFKIVTAGPYDDCIGIWETGTGNLANVLDCKTELDEAHERKGVAALAVDGCRIVTAHLTRRDGGLCYRDFSNCLVPASCLQSSDESTGSTSKFWEAADVFDS